ncbi:MAG: phosphoenolpyruvate--protein phosphotransferase [Phycisphaerales bacterium]
MDILKGIAVSPGVMIGRVFVLDDVRRAVPKRTIAESLVPDELARLDKAIADSVAELAEMRQSTARELGDEAAKIFAFHIGMLGDPTLTKPMRDRISKERVSAEYAAWIGFQEAVKRFASMPDVFKTKIDDVRDLSLRVLRHLIGAQASRLATLNHRAIVVAKDLTPSQTAAFDRNHVIAFATDLGGKTSHTAIFARALGIPAVVGLGNITSHASDGADIIIDGDRGVAILSPDAATIAEYQAIIEQRRTYQLSLEELGELPSITRDGQRIHLLGNIEMPEEIPAILEAGGEGVGLYRTEFLYLTGASEPTEDDHYRAYTLAIDMLRGKILTIRTVDLGADKYTQERAENPERNPALGLRSIRYCLQSLPMFKTQLRAILRASARGPVKVMFPLITSTNEFRQGKYLLNDVMEDLSDEGVPFDRNIDVGMMVEVPSAAIMADVFAREAAFFSIGTNDLVQYTLAVDRINERVANLYNPAHPAVIKLIRDVIRAARRRNVPVSCCGESAGELDFVLLLIGLGLRTLSVTASSIAPVKRLVRSVTVEQCEKLAQKACSLDSDLAVSALLRDQVRKILPEAFDGRSAEH